MQTILSSLRKQYPQITFTAGNIFFWSPVDREIVYVDGANDNAALWALMHEMGHALLDHKSYDSDFELLKLEIQAWDKACDIAKDYKKTIDSEHIQDCLDTYRDWLHKRSTCPNCMNQSFQKDQQHYQCFNCHAQWKVTSSRLCRPYRLLKQAQKETSPDSNELQAMFM